MLYHIHFTVVSYVARMLSTCTHSVAVHTIVLRIHSTAVPAIATTHIYTTIMHATAPHIHCHYRGVYVRGYRDSVLQTHG